MDTALLKQPKVRPGAGSLSYLQDAQALVVNDELAF